jgi:hypothetical protein
MFTVREELGRSKGTFIDCMQPEEEKVDFEKELEVQ